MPYIIDYTPSGENIMPYCSKCGGELEETDDFCSKCGKIVVRKDTSKTEKRDTNEILLKRGKIQNQTRIVLLLLVVVGIATLGILIFYPQIQSNQNRPVNQQSSGTQLTGKSECPYECCFGSPQYLDKQCSGVFKCINNACVKADCPFECCNEGGDYKPKDCQQYYECQNHKCVAVDSDKDGLPDYEETQLGTNPNLADTDGDGLSDYIEVKVKHTKPLNPNTDNDRYIDSQDPNPLKANSAKIESMLTGKANREINTPILVIAAGTCILSSCTITGVLAALKPDEWIYKDKWDFKFSNVGDDYTSYYNADFAEYCAKKKIGTREEMLKDKVANSNDWRRIYSEHISLNQMNPGNSEMKEFTHMTTLQEIPDYLINAVIKGGVSCVGVIEDEDYEKYL